ncbi:hypothetical protein PL9631_510005 [Planktothrix paucivesiculata PCC 9631]|uniref:Uncharacterized protein n=1 Tax=Planktothrix paucivesiculata PCC 9631 TaxID=671071 RepID=A0A7Z9BWI8_9CYAN|nr:hypothetical protein PL9631_510005 [Planktothrix paucivesiculata PCC 9631]
MVIPYSLVTERSRSIPYSLVTERSRSIPYSLFPVPCSLSQLGNLFCTSTYKFN